MTRAPRVYRDIPSLRRNVRIRPERPEGHDDNQFIGCYSRKCPAPVTHVAHWDYAGQDGRTIQAESLLCESHARAFAARHHVGITPPAGTPGRQSDAPLYTGASGSWRSIVDAGDLSIEVAVVFWWDLSVTDGFPGRFWEEFEDQPDQAIDAPGYNERCEALKDALIPRLNGERERLRCLVESVFRDLAAKAGKP